MEIRAAKIEDVKTIYALISSYAERDIMLFRSMADIYEHLQTFIVVELEGTVVGCCALQIIWSDLAEIKSLAVDSSQTGTGIGKKLIENALQTAEKIGVGRVFALTMNTDFFKKAGFKVIDKEDLPMKVWSDCAKCPKQNNCDETAVIRTVDSRQKTELWG